MLLLLYKFSIFTVIILFLPYLKGLKKIFFIILGLRLAFFAPAQITVQDNINMTTLVNSLKGTGVEINNIKYDCEVGSVNPYGYYKDTSGMSGLKEGLLLTTGLARNAVGPNNRSGQGTQNSFDPKFDSDLSTLVNFNQSNGNFYDICMVEFDISIYSDEFKFEYVFASEEYPEFVGSFHDLFGFFISGPGINGTKNIALIPNTNDPVSVSNVNQNVNSFYYKSNGDGIIPPYSPVMQYDGYTKVLIAQTKVIPCETYHIKLIIADEGDGIYDSGIFLEAGSFKSTDERISQRYEHPQYDYGIEGCNKGYFVFSRIGAEKNNLANPIYLEYSITGTAQNGQDYNTISNSIIIPAFQDSIELEIDAISDDIKENDETVSISITNDCPALPPTFSSTMIIKDYFDFSMPLIRACVNDTLQLNNPISTSNYLVNWEDSVALSCTACTSPFAYITENTSFPFTLTDPKTNCIAKGEANVELFPATVAYFTYSLSDYYTNLDLFFNNGSSLATHFFWDFGDGDTSNQIHPMHIFDNLNNNYEKVEYLVTLTAKNKETGCEDQFFRTIIIDKPFLIPNIITPNQDGQNDAFYIAGIQQDVWSLKLYNRWGKTIYQTDLYNNRWQAENIPDGVYYYELINPLKDKHFKGWLQIIH